MQSFIAQTWEHLSQHVSHTDRLRCIVPSIRAGNFLRQTIQAQQKEAGFLPEIITIETFIQELADLQIIDDLPLLFECYQVYTKRQPEQIKDDFDTFTSWASVLLADFNEIDRYLVPPKSFFDYLAGVQQLNHWSLAEAPTDMMRAYLSFWNQLEGYYQDLRAALMQKGLGYQGMVYREATGHVAFYLEAKGDRPHAFIGFNALNNAEQQLFQEFLAEGNHFVYWDADKHFVSDKKHTAAMFMRRYFKQWPYYEKETPLFIAENYGGPKKVELVQTANALDQVKEIGRMLEQFSPEQCKNTAIVLADEDLLLPLLNSLPENIQNVNITMGVSLKLQPLTRWLLLILELHIKYPENFYYKVLFRLLEDPMAKILLNDPLQTVKRMTRENQVTINYNELQQDNAQEDTAVLQKLFAPWPNGDINEALKRLEVIIASFLDVNNDIHRTSAVKLQQVVVQMRNMQARYQSISSLEALRNVLRQLAAKGRMDFQGDAYDGLQIMGVLESRALDFERVMIASVNEGFLPSGQNPPSYITNDMKLQYQLPSLFEKDAIFTYHFYRLLHRAKTVSILYTAVGGGFQSKEESRLVKQLRLDSKQHELTERTLRPQMKPQIIPLRSLIKTPEVMQALDAIAKKQYSPSALITYIRNPIDFYTQKVLGVRQADELEEDIALNTLGSVVHKTIEELYLPLVGTKLQEGKLKALLPKVTQTLTKHSLEHLGKHYLLGKNRIVFEVSQQYVQYAIKSDLAHLKAGRDIELLAIEKELSTHLQHAAGGTISLGGVADRIDRLDGRLRIIDYKTGKVEPGQLHLQEWAPLTQDYKYSKAFQVLLYGYMYWKQYSELPDRAGIISFRQQTHDFMAFGWKQSSRGIADAALSEQVMSAFEAELVRLFDEIYDLNIPFTEKEV